MGKRLFSAFICLMNLTLLASLVPGDAWSAATWPVLASEPNQARVPAAPPSQDASDLSYDLLYSTCLGGYRYGTGVAVDGAGNAYVVFDEGSYGARHVFVTKLSADDGTPLLPDISLGPGESHGGIAVDEAGNAYVTIGRPGFEVRKLDDSGTLDPDYVFSAGIDVDVDGEGNVFSSGSNYVLKVPPNGEDERISFEGGSPPVSYGIAVDEAGNAYVTSGNKVVKVKVGDPVSHTASLEQSGIQWWWGIAVDETGNAYVTGESYVTGETHVAKVEFDDAVTAVHTATLPDGYWGRAIAVDRAGSAFVTGSTSSGEVFVAKVNVDDNRVFSATFGGSRPPSSDYGHSIAVDEAGNVYVTGATSSGEAFTTTVGACSGPFDAFVLKLAVESEEPPVETITGLVLLQGRTAHAGTNIFLSEEPCSGPLSGSPAAVTNDAGHFEITAPPGQTYQCLQAFQPGYLLGERTSPQGDLGTITLPAGDVIQDNVIDIFDLTLIADHYHSPDPIADLDADGWVNIYDVAMVGGNYNTNGPVTNWQ
jgi:hypothetical protein